MANINIDNVLDKTFFEKKLFSNHFEHRKLSSRVLSNCFVVPHPKHGFGGIVDSNNNYVKDSALHNLTHNVDYVIDDDYSFVEDTVIYFGVICKGWGHFLTDSLKRAWFFLKNNDAAKYKIIAISDDDTAPHGNFKRALELLGIDSDSFLLVKKTTRFRTIIYPDSSFFCDPRDNRRYFTEEYRATIKTISDNAVYNPKYEIYKKVFFPFSHYKRKKDNRIRSVGECELESLFKKAGFRIVRPEKLSLDDQISLLRNINTLASTDGSCSHNSIFLSNKSNLIIIPRGPYSSEYQDALNYVNDINIFYVDSSLSIFSKEESLWGGPFYFYASKRLQLFLELDYKKTFHFRKFHKYFMIALDNNLANRQLTTNEALKKEFDDLFFDYSRSRFDYFIHRAFNRIKRIIH